MNLLESFVCGCNKICNAALADFAPLQWQFCGFLACRKNADKRTQWRTVRFYLRTEQAFEKNLINTHKDYAHED